MPKTEIAKAVCEECGSDVREGTTFCYNCGSSLVQSEPEMPEIAVDDIDPKSVDENTKAALDDLAERLKLDEDEDNKLAKAAAERKKARVSQRKSYQYTWESSEDSSGSLVVLVALLIGTLAAASVFVALFWR